MAFLCDIIRIIRKEVFMIEKVKNEVAKILDKDNSGHGMEHINRVLDLAFKFD